MRRLGAQHLLADVALDPRSLLLLLGLVRVLLVEVEAPVVVEYPITHVTADGIAGVPSLWMFGLHVIVEGGLGCQDFVADGTLDLLRLPLFCCPVDLLIMDSKTCLGMKDLLARLTGKCLFVMHLGQVFGSLISIGEDFITFRAFVLNVFVSVLHVFLQVPLRVVLLVALRTRHLFDHPVLDEVVGLVVFVALPTVGLVVATRALVPLPPPVPFLMLQEGVLVLERLAAIRLRTLLGLAELLVNLHVLVEGEPPLEHLAALFAGAGLVKHLFLLLLSVLQLRFSHVFISRMLFFNNVTVSIGVFFLDLHQIGLDNVITALDEAPRGVRDERLAVRAYLLLATSALVLEHVNHWIVLVIFFHVLHDVIGKILVVLAHRTFVPGKGVTFL